MNGPGTIPDDGCYSFSGDLFSSYCPGGSHFLRVVGSVPFVSENIDQVLLDTTATSAAEEAIPMTELYGIVAVPGRSVTFQHPVRQFCSIKRSTDETQAELPRL